MEKNNKRILLAKVIGEYVESLRSDKELNQAQLALLSGVPEGVTCLLYNFCQKKETNFLL